MRIFSCDFLEQIQRVFCRRLIVVVDISINSLAGGDTEELVLGMESIPVSCRWITEGSSVGLKRNFKLHDSVQSIHRWFVVRTTQH